jgi:hypothetical protein
MKKDKKIILLSFATEDLKKTIKRLTVQATESGYYDEINILNPKNINSSNKNKLDKLISMGKKRGYAYWYWKPLLILQTLENINNGDIIHYLDAGFHIYNNRSKKFYEYIDLISDPDKWLLAFQYKSIHINNSQDIIFPKREEHMYTKGDIFSYFKCSDKKEFTHTPQFSAGSFFLKKSDKSYFFLKKWVEVFEKRFDLIDDTISKIPNFETFIENRHDQSIFSILCKINCVEALSAYEFDWAKKNNKRTWEHNLHNPFLAKRDLQYNIFRRFFNRQKKNYNRLLAKL